MTTLALLFFHILAERATLFIFKKNYIQKGEQAFNFFNSPLPECREAVPFLFV